MSGWIDRWRQSNTQPTYLPPTSNANTTNTIHVHEYINHFPPNINLCTGAFGDACRKHSSRDYPQMKSWVQAASCKIRPSCTIGTGGKGGGQWKLYLRNYLTRKTRSSTTANNTDQRIQDLLHQTYVDPASIVQKVLTSYSEVLYLCKTTYHLLQIA